MGYVATTGIDAPEVGVFDAGDPVPDELLTKYPWMVEQGIVFDPDAFDAEGGIQPDDAEPGEQVSEPPPEPVKATKATKKAAT